MVGKKGVLVWDVTFNSILWSSDHSNYVTDLCFSPDNSKVVSGSEDYTLNLWDAINGSLLWTGQHSGSVGDVSFSFDGFELKGLRYARHWTRLHATP